MLDPDVLRRRALEQVLYEEAWKNERTINLFRGAIWIAVGVAMAAINLPSGGQIQWTGFIHLGWGLSVLAFNQTWMKARFHAAIPWVLTSVDIIVLIVGMQEGYVYILQNDPGLAEHHISGVTVGLFLIIGLNMMRFSWRLTVWSFVAAVGAFTFIRVLNGRFDRLAVVDIVLISSMCAMLLYTSMRFRAIVEKVMIDLRRIQEERVASLGALVAGVAHELNTPIGALSSNVQISERAIQILKAALEDPAGEALAAAKPKVRRAIPTLEKVTGGSKVATDRVSTVVSALKTFARLDQADVQIADLREGIESALQLVSGQSTQHVSFEKDLAEIPPIPCRPAQLNQVFMHVLKNSIEAIDEKGHVVIRTRAEVDRVVVEIEDDGRGIEKERLERIFDPGFSRAGTRAKMGFGLSASYGIVQDHGGTIDIDSEAGTGTTVRIGLPI